MVFIKARYWRLLSLARSFLALLAFAMGATCLSHAESNSTIRFDAIIGYSSVSPLNAWFPITCELQNSGPTITGIIEISSDQLTQGQNRRIKVELPSNTIKRITIPVFSTSRFNNWNVKLLSENGKTIAEPNYIGNRRIPGNPELGVLSRTASGVPSFPEIKSRNNEQQPLAVRLQTELFPDNPIVLDGIKAIYLSSERAAGLSVAQVNALLAWMEHGGNLVVGVESPQDLTSSEWLNKILPCDLDKTVSLNSHAEFQQYIHEFSAIPGEQVTANPPVQKQSSPSQKKNANNKKTSANPTPSLRQVDNANNLTGLEVSVDTAFENAALPAFAGSLRDGQVILSSGSIPLIIQAPRGHGKITILTFSPEREPFQSWKNRVWFWTKLVGISPNLYTTSEYTSDYGRASSDGVIGSMIDSKQVRKLPLGWLLLLLAVYLVVIGPLDQYWLKKINRQMLTWITFPLYVIAFSVLIYFIGFYLRAGDLEYNELSIVDVLPNNLLTPAEKPLEERTSAVGGDSAVLRGQTYCSIYSPVNARYPLASDLPYATFRGEFMDIGSGQSGRATIEQHGNSFKAEATVPVWTSQLFVSDWLQPSSMPFEVNLSSTEHNWDVVIRNKSDRKFTSVHIALMGRIYELGTLQPASTNSFKLTSEKGVLLSDFANKNGFNLRRAADMRRSSFGNNSVEIGNIALGSIAVSFASLCNPPRSNQAGNYDSGIATPEGLDLSTQLQHNQGVLFAWDENHSFVPSFNKFSSKRYNRNTLLRVLLPMKQKPTAM